MAAISVYLPLYRYGLFIDRCRRTRYHTRAMSPRCAPVSTALTAGPLRQMKARQMKASQCAIVLPFCRVVMRRTQLQGSRRCSGAVIDECHATIFGWCAPRTRLRDS